MLEVEKQKERKQTHMKQIKPAQSYIDQDRAKTLLEKWAPLAIARPVASAAAPELISTTVPPAKSSAPRLSIIHPPLPP